MFSLSFSLISIKFFSFSVLFRTCEIIGHFRKVLSMLLAMLLVTVSTALMNLQHCKFVLKRKKMSSTNKRNRRCSKVKTREELLLFHSERSSNRFARRLDFRKAKEMRLCRKSLMVKQPFSFSHFNWFQPVYSFFFTLSQLACWVFKPFISAISASSNHMFPALESNY